MDPSRGDKGVLTAHVARVNPVWQALPPDGESLVIFQASDVYITPSWYPSKQTHGKTVPTWNCAVVHAYGTPRAIEDRHWLHTHLEALTRHHEYWRPAPWTLSDAPDDYIERMLGFIVGIEIRITRLLGKWKVSQNRPDTDKRGVAAGLRARGGDDAEAMAALIEKHLDGASRS